jgi:glycopeptide antibiotics resistance protein
MRYINEIPILLIFTTLICYIPVRLFYRKHKKLTSKFSEEIILVFLIAYIESLLYLTLFPSSPGPQNEVKVNFIPFETINLYLNYHDNISLQIINLVGNVVIFIPIGIFASLLLKKNSFLKMLFIGFASTLFIETMQLILSINGIISRSFDVDDLLLNTIGVLIGYIIWAITFKLYQHFKNSRN